MTRRQTFTITHDDPTRSTLPTLNEYVEAERTNRFIGAKLKREATEKVRLAAVAAGLSPVEKYPVSVRCHWVEPNARKDHDNVRFGVKFVLDGLVSAGVLANDGPRYVAGLSDTYAVNKAAPRVVVEIMEGVE